MTETICVQICLHYMMLYNIGTNTSVTMCNMYCSFADLPQLKHLLMIDHGMTNRQFTREITRLLVTDQITMGSLHWPSAYSWAHTSLTIQMRCVSACEKSVNSIDATFPKFGIEGCHFTCTYIIKEIERFNQIDIAERTEYYVLSND